MSNAYSSPTYEDDDEYPEVTQTDHDRATFRVGLKPAPHPDAIKKIEIALQIDTGNTIYEEFTTIEEALAFVQKYAQSPQAILEKIKPKGIV